MPQLRQNATQDSCHKWKDVVLGWNFYKKISKGVVSVVSSRRRAESYIKEDI